jgi:transcription-repair coupling factor (superfamily II helicase)
LTALAAIQPGHAAPQPMDRLLCGDVGFGKTELAMRAAFKAVDNGYQVAVLAPTTVLVEQHYRTFRERMAEFPFDIAKLSRFGTAARAARDRPPLAAGQIDIVIGTHRWRRRTCVPQPGAGDHRRGAAVRRRGQGAAEGAALDGRRADAVGHADPAHAAHVAGRRARHLEPGDAARGPLAVETRVTRFDRELIRHAVLRELNRGGQIFFVHNRVEDIRASSSSG